MQKPPASGPVRNAKPAAAPAAHRAAGVALPQPADEQPHRERREAHGELARDQGRDVPQGGKEDVEHHEVAVVGAERVPVLVQERRRSVLPDPAEPGGGGEQAGRPDGRRAARAELPGGEPHAEPAGRDAAGREREQCRVQVARQRAEEPAGDRVVQPRVGVRLAGIHAARRGRPRRQLADPSLVPQHVGVRRPQERRGPQRSRIHDQGRRRDGAGHRQGCDPARA